MLTDEQLAAIPHWVDKRSDESSNVFTDRCYEYVKDVELQEKDIFSFAYQEDPPEYDSSLDGSHGAMIISFTDSYGHYDYSYC